MIRQKALGAGRSVLGIARLIKRLAGFADHNRWCGYRSKRGQTEAAGIYWDGVNGAGKAVGGFDGVGTFGISSTASGVGDSSFGASEKSFCSWN